MKPEDFKVPFKWEERQVLIKDRIWHVPASYDRYEDFVFPGWKAPEVFGNDCPIKIEYCSGNGLWITAKAIAEPQSNWIAVEKQFVRARKIGAKIHNLKLNNLLTVCAEAHTVTQHYFPSESVQEIFINFPDPWPKRRHAKHRLIYPGFLDEIYRILNDAGTITIVTDDVNYSQLTIKEFAKHCGFKSFYPEPFYSTEMPGYGTSYFEELWRQKGRMIRYHRFFKL